MRSTGRCGVGRRASPCSSLRTLPGAASVVLASSAGVGCCFVFFFKPIVPIPHIYSYLSIHNNLICVVLEPEWVNRQVQIHEHLCMLVRFPACSLSFLVYRTCSNSFCWASCGFTTDPSTSIRPDIRAIIFPYDVPGMMYLTCVIHIDYCCRCFCLSMLVLLLLQLLLFVVVCRMAQNVDGSVSLIPFSVSILFIQIRIFQGCVRHGT